MLLYDLAQNCDLQQHAVVLLSDNHDIISMKLYDINVGHKVKLFVNCYCISDPIAFIVGFPKLSYLFYSFSF